MNKYIDRNGKALSSEVCRAYDAYEAKIKTLETQLEVLTRCEWANSYPQCDESKEVLCRACENLKQIKEGE